MFCYRSLDYAIDDAWIPARVARTFLENGVWTYDITRASVESFSSPLWLGLHALLLSVAPDADPVPTLRLFGAGLGIALVMLSAAAAGSMCHTPRNRTIASGLTGIALALHPGLMVHAVNGLETSAWLLALALGAFGLATRRVNAMAFACVCLVWLRPEGMLLGPALGLLAWWNHPHGRRVAVLSIGALAVLLLMRQQLYGEWLPMTAFAKSPNLGHGMHYVGEWVRSTGLLTLLCLAWWRPWQALGVAALAMMAALTGGDWMPGGRRTLEATVALAVAVGALHARGPMVPLAVIAWLGTSGYDMARGHAAVRWYHGAFADIGQRVHQTPDIERVLAFDVGRLGWHGHASVYDLAGLTDKHIGQLPGSHGQKSFDATYFEQQAPDLVVLTTTNDPTEASPRFYNAEAAVYEHLSAHPDYLFAGRRAVGSPDHILLFVRAGTELPADVWQGWSDGR